LDYQDLNLDQRSDGVWVITLNRPNRLNAMRQLTVHEMLGIIEAASVSDEAKVLVITGTGRGFCTGADLLGGGSPEDAAPLTERAGYRRMKEGAIGHWGVLFSALGHFPKPYIAAVNGIAAGAGLSLALAADIRVASTAAQFISIFVRRGLTPDTGTTFHLPRLIGDSRALEMMFTGDSIDASTAERWGLVSRVVAPEAFMEETLALAGRIARGPSVTIELTKRLVRDLTHTELDRQLQNEAWAIGIQTEDRAEGGHAFRERREPQWTGR
jgi:2-(1,2-epoxy-1,2-dihydrophenyl)acetyl-CoA isomerase